ncbi:transposase [Sporolactobacillus mangiferae]|uniref:transposase n=1 Tax=Sporolactobacillus mangiferae TaxID=2940498 RepID=UPI0034A0FA32
MCSHFDSPNQINAYIGIDLHHYKSGQYTAADTISKREMPWHEKSCTDRSIGTIASTARFTYLSGNNVRWCQIDLMMHDHARRTASFTQSMLLDEVK